MLSIASPSSLQPNPQHPTPPSAPARRPSIAPQDPPPFDLSIQQLPPQEEVLPPFVLPPQTSNNLEEVAVQHFRNMDLVPTPSKKFKGSENNISKLAHALDVLNVEHPNLHSVERLPEGHSLKRKWPEPPKQHSPHSFNSSVPFPERAPFQSPPPKPRTVRVLKKPLP